MSKKELKALREEGRIEFAPLAFMRGRTFSDAWILLDEAQNATPAQMRMALTRIGHNSKMVITGDLDQCDLREPNGLEDLVTRLGLRYENVESLMGHVNLTDAEVMRSEVVREVLDLYRLQPQWSKHAVV
jgi:phosphate starvation-inducible PhoH-like protein